MCVVIVLVLQFCTLCVVTYTNALWQWGFVRYERGQGLFVARYIPWPFPAAVRELMSGCVDCALLDIWKDRSVLGQCMCVSQHDHHTASQGSKQGQLRRSISATCYHRRSVAFARIRQNIHCKKIAPLFLSTIYMDILRNFKLNRIKLTQKIVESWITYKKKSLNELFWWVNAM